MIKPGQEYIFSKSGNRVRAIAPADDGLWTVERVDGESAGKQMLAPAIALYEPDVWQRMTTGWEAEQAREAIDRGLNYKSPYSEGGKS